MRTASIWSKVVSGVVTVLCLAGAAGADSGDATDAAFGALLAMPGVQPKPGGWIIPELAEPTPKSEQDLISRLKNLKKTGANFNAIRHGGTLLAHAIRAGKNRTAIWLLSNGGDPKNVLRNRQETAYDLARQFKRVALIKVLEDQHGFKPPEASTQGADTQHAPVPVLAAEAAPQSRSEQAISLLKRVIGPSRSPTEAGHKEWREFAATLSRDEYAAIFKDRGNLWELVDLSRKFDGALEEGLSHLPLDVVRQNAQLIAGILAEGSGVTFNGNQRVAYNPTSLSWPALWKRIDQPLHYDKLQFTPGHVDRREYLARNISPELWPGLFGSGYPWRDAEKTDCLLAEMDVASFKRHWPIFQSSFVNARELAPTLVLKKYLVSRESHPCDYSGPPEETVAKLAFLREQGVTAQVFGLSKKRLAEDADANSPLAAMVAKFSGKSNKAPRLVQVPVACILAFNDTWLDALVTQKGVGSTISGRSVQAIQVPGHEKCGIVVGGDKFEYFPELGDDFFEGPLIEGSTRCADATDDWEIWVEEKGTIRSINKGISTEGAGTVLRDVRDIQTGKRYILNEGRRGAWCNITWQLPDAYEWKSGTGSSGIIESGDQSLIDRVLGEQCGEINGESRESGYPNCRGFFAPFAEYEDPKKRRGADVFTVLRRGGPIPREWLVDQLGSGRREAYRSAIAARDRGRIRQLHASGIPARWTASEILALATAKLPLEEKRRRNALLFANPDRLDSALRVDSYDFPEDLPESLLTWLPTEDWPPVLRVIGRDPRYWYERAKRLREKAATAKRNDLACEIDRAQGFLCGGGLVFH